MRSTDGASQSSGHPRNGSSNTCICMAPACSQLEACLLLCWACPGLDARVYSLKVVRLVEGDAQMFPHIAATTVTRLLAEAKLYTFGKKSLCSQDSTRPCSC